MPKKNKIIIIISVISVITTILLSIAIVIGLKYYNTTTMVVSTLNSNLEIRQDLNNQLLAITTKLQPKDNTEKLDLATLESAKTDLVAFNDGIMDKKLRLKSGDSDDLKKSYNLYSEVIDAYSATGFEILQTTETLACMTQKSETLQTSLSTTQTTFNELGTIEDTKLLADKTAEVGRLFTANATLYADTKTCFNQEDEKALFENANNGSTVDIETATADLGSLFTDLSNAIREENITKIQQVNTSIEGITKSGNIDFDSKFSEAFDLEYQKINQSLNTLTAKSALLDQELDVINKKYNLTSVEN